MKTLFATWPLQAKMAAVTLAGKFLTPTLIPYAAARGLQTTAVLSKANKLHIRAGRFRPTTLQNLPLTYDESKPPYLIGVEKSWSTWNTSNLTGEGRKSQTLLEDVFIRNFMEGVWQGQLASEVVIKRRHNTIVISAMVRRFFKPQSGYFLLGFSEELLSCLLKCVVKVEVQSVDPMDLTFKKI